jgi:hypothetical protein
MTAADTLATVEFIGYTTVIATALPFTYYALRNYALDRMEGLDELWGYLTYVGLSLAIFGALGLGLSVGGGVFVRAFTDVSLLFAIVFVAFAMRECFYDSALAPPPEERKRSLESLRLLEFGFVLVIAVEWVVVVALGETTVTTVTRSVAALAFAAYGVAFSERLEALAHGTAVDTLRRHLLLVLVTATGFAVADLFAVLGPGSVGSSLSYVFLLLLGGLLIPPTIRLQQSVAGLS